MVDNTSYGTCTLCGTRSSKSGMVSHLRQCVKEQETAGETAGEELYHLRIEDRYSGNYWLDLEVKSPTHFAEVDAFLRHVWLECCNHTSAFEVGDTHYVTPFNTRLAVLPSERDMTVSLEEVFGSELSTFTYDYDFTSTTRLTGEVMGQRVGQSKKALRLMARNEPVEQYCNVCNKAAGYICSYHHENPFLCDLHAQVHGCGTHALLPVVNSPRMGVCAYEG